MSDLRLQQIAFQAAVLHGDVGGLLQHAPGGGPAPIDVYRQAHHLRLVEALHDNFEILALALGDEGFDALASAYLRAHPSVQPSIRWFGHRLIEFMDACVAAADALVPHPALADLARMDWALRGAFDAMDAPPISRDDLIALPPERWPGLCLVLHPSVSQLSLRWAVEPAWQSLHSAAAGSECKLPAPQPQPHDLLVWRRGLEPQWRSLGDSEAELLRLVASGQPFAALCEQALADDESPADQVLPRVVGRLQQWLADGLVTGFTLR